jgi:hypothetical protein
MNLKGLAWKGGDKVGEHQGFICLGCGKTFRGSGCFGPHRSPICTCEKVEVIAIEEALKLVRMAQEWLRMGGGETDARV